MAMTEMAITSVVNFWVKLCARAHERGHLIRQDRLQKIINVGFYLKEQ